MKIEMPAWRLYELKVILSYIGKDMLWNKEREDAKKKDEKTVQHAFQAVTLKRKIVEAIEKTNKDFEENVKKAREVIAKVQDDFKKFAVEQGVPTNHYGPSLDELIKKMPEEAQKEINDWWAENQAKLTETIRKEHGLVYGMLKVKTPWMVKETHEYVFAPALAEEGEEQPKEETIVLNLDDAKKQGEFLKEIYKWNVFDVISDEETAVKLGELLNIEL